MTVALIEKNRKWEFLFNGEDDFINFHDDDDDHLWGTFLFSLEIIDLHEPGEVPTYKLKMTVELMFPKRTEQRRVNAEAVSIAMIDHYFRNENKCIIEKVFPNVMRMNITQAQITNPLTKCVIRVIHKQRENISRD